MLNKGLLVGLALCTTALMACSGDSKTPVSPTTTSTPTVDTEAAADGSTLKVSAPTPSSPADGVTLTTLTPSLVVTSATGNYVTTSGLGYRFSVETTGGTEVYRSGLVSESGSSVKTATVAVPSSILAHETTYRWRARAESGTAYGPWSNYRSLTTPIAKVDPSLLPSYQKSDEIWDNLADGKTIGTAYGGVKFIAGRGAQFPAFASRITYTLGTTMTAGAMEWVIENLDPDSDGGKTKVVSMQEGYGDITANAYRFNLEKRGDDHADVGKFRVRIITGNSEEGHFSDSDRWTFNGFSISQTYHMRLTWGNGTVRFTVRDNNGAGTVRMDNAFTYSNLYQPSPHVVHLGAPVPRGGEQDATVPGMIIRYFHLSNGSVAYPGPTSVLKSLASTLGLTLPTVQ